MEIDRLIQINILQYIPNILILRQFQVIVSYFQCKVSDHHRTMKNYNLIIITVLHVLHMLLLYNIYPIRTGKMFSEFFEYCL